MRLWIPLSVVALFGCGPRVPVDTDTADTDTDTDSDTDTDTDSDTDTDAEPNCPETPDDAFYGLLEAGDVSAVNTYADSNLSAVVAAFDGLADGTKKTVSIQVTDAVVSTIGYAPSTATELWTVWLADSKTAVRTYIDDDNSPGAIPGTVKPGDTLSFTVTEIYNFGGEQEITQIDAVTVGTSTSKVWIQDLNGTTITYAEHGRELVHVWGEVSSDPADCGSFKCMDLKLPTQTIDFRVKKDYAKGDCLDVVAPIGVYNGSAQFNIDNFDWVTVY